MILVAGRRDVRAAALAAIDREIARLHEHSGTVDEFGAALDWAQIDALLDRRLKVSARRTDAAEGSSPAGAPDSLDEDGR